MLDRLNAFGLWMLRIPLWMFVVIIGAIALMKATFVWKALYFAKSALLFPQPLDTQSNQVIGILAYRLTGGSPWLYMTLVSVSFLIAIVLIWRSPVMGSMSREPSRVRLVLAVSWPFLMADIAWLGDGREFLPMFVALAILSRSPWLVGLGIVGAALTHPEHATLAFLMLLLLSGAPDFRQWRRRAASGFAFSAVVLCSATLWQYWGGAESRLSVLGELLNESVRGFLRQGFLGAYSWWGVWWVVVLFVLFTVGKKSAIFIVVSAILLPALITAMALDGTRIFTAVASAVGLALMMNFLKARSTPEVSEQAGSLTEFGGLRLGAVILGLIVLPNVQVKMIGDGIPAPGYFWVGLVENYGSRVIEVFSGVF